MEPREIAAQVEQEIAGQWSRSNAHGVDLRRCLVTPRLIRCRNTFPTPDAPSPRELELWLVLTEIPDSTDGYLIVCDQAAERFGLAITSTEDEVVFLGWYGGFWDAFESM